jgi:N-acylneuraminate cytidylyltransferase
MTRVLAVIPARGGSRGLPGKNVRPLGGVPLIGHTVRFAARQPEVTRAIVTTDDEGIAAVARDHGADVPFVRPAELARDDTPMAPVVRHALEQVEAEEGTAYDVVLLLDPTSPVRDPEAVRAALARLDAAGPEVDGVVSVSQPTFNPLWVGVRAGDDGRLGRYFPEAAGITRRQDAGRYLRINGNFYAWRSAFVRRLSASWLDEGTFLGHEIPELQAYSIDDEQELTLVEALARAGLVTLPGTEE